MSQAKIEIKIEELTHEELSPLEIELKARALASADNAYAPYSNFHVGVALLLANGKIVTGNNQENIAYPSGLCAERVALFYAGAAYPDVAIRTIMIVAGTNGKLKDHISPCGACRQVMLETEQRYKSPIRVILCGKKKIYAFSSTSDLLPLSFKM